MLEFYYLNKGVINSQYAQIVPHVVEKLEKWKSHSIKSNLKLSLGSFLKYIGLNLGSLEPAIEWGRTTDVRETHAFTDEQRLSLVWKHLKENDNLIVLTDGTRITLEVGKSVLFDGSFTFVDFADDVAELKGTIGSKAVSIHFSKESVPLTILSTLQFHPENVPLSGYGIIMKADQEYILLRPIAFGLNFLEVLDLNT